VDIFGTGQEHVVDRFGTFYGQIRQMLLTFLVEVRNM